MSKIVAIIAILLLCPFNTFAATYWVSSTGAATWSNCSSETPLSGISACSVSTANSNAAAGDIVYLREGTYEVTGNAIDPTNSGSSGNVITFSGYESETVTFHGSTDITGASSRAINLNSDSYIKVTKLNFTNMFQGFVINAGGHNEISYCVFSFRDYYNDVHLSGTAKADSSSYLYDTENDLSSYGSKVLFNVTDKSAVAGESSPTTDTIDHYNSRTLAGGADSDETWQIGDSYRVLSVQSYDPAHCDIGGSSTHNWVHHNTIHGGGALTPQGDEGVLFSVGFTSSTTEECSNNTVEYNHIYHGGHHVFAVNSGFYNVVRKNYFHNEGWYDDSSTYQICSGGDNGKCGYRVLYSAGHEDHVGRTLYEENFVGYGAQYGAPHPTTGGSGNGFALANPNNIVRYNTFTGNAQYGLSLGNSLTATPGFGYGNHNMIYNNTFLSNGYNWSSGGTVSEDDSQNVDSWRTGIHFYNSDTVHGNIIKNNLFHNSWTLANKLTGSVYYPDINAVSETNISNNTIESNYTTDNTYLSGGSAFTDTTSPAFISEVLPANSAEIIAAWSDYAVSTPNLSLQPSSPVIDEGTYLTTVHADDTGSGTSLILTDASYFQAGSAAATTPMGSSLSTIVGDYIKVGATVATAEEVQITDINYSTNTVTITPAITREDGDYVWLSKKSDGTRVLYGSAPDYGAHEYYSHSRFSGGTVSGGIF